MPMEKRMKIVINTISTKKVTGGAFQIACNFIAKSLAEPVSDIDWYYLTSEDVDEFVHDKFSGLIGIKYFVFPTQPDYFHTHNEVQKKISQWEDKVMPDLIYTISSPCYMRFKTTEVMRFANAWVTNPNKYAWHSLQMNMRIRMWLYCVNQRRLLRKAKYVITQSEIVKSNLINKLNFTKEQIGVVPNVLPEIYQSINVKQKVANEWIDFICVGTDMAHKNFELIPQVLVSLQRVYRINNVRFHFTLKQDCNLYKKILNEANKNGQKDYIINHGRLSQSELAELYQKCDYCFLPSLLETFSVSSLEAMFFKLPIIASDFDFHRNVICDAGLFFKPTDAMDAARTIAKLVCSESLKSHLINNMEKRILIYNNYTDHFQKTILYLKEFYKRELHQ